MGLDDFVGKASEGLKKGTSKVNEARKSPQAGQVRESVVDGVDKVLRTVLPGHQPEELEAPKPVIPHPSSPEEVAETPGENPGSKE